LGIIPDNLEETELGGLSAQLIEVLIETRAKLRQAKQFALADQIRDRLGVLGIVLEDTPGGTTWRYAQIGS